MNMTATMTPQRAQKIIAAKLRPAEKRARSDDLSETLVRIGRLEPAKVDHVLAYQAKTGMPFGRCAVRLGLVRPQDLQFALGVQMGFLHETKEAVAIPSPLVVLRNPYSPEAEEFNLMRTRLITGFAREKLNLFSITGADAKSGAVFTAGNLAASFAQLGRRVVLIDADLRKRKLARMFGAAGAPGVTDFVDGAASYAEIVHGTLVKGLDLVPAGTPTRDPQSVLSAGAFKELLDAVRNEYDIAIVLTSSFGGPADAEFVWAATQNVITLARKDYTRAKTLTHMRSVIRGVGADIIGAAMAA